MLKKFFMTLITIILIVGMSSSVNAANEQIVINKTVTNFKSFESEEGGDIILELSNIKLKSTSSYKYKLNYNTLETKWYDITDLDTENNIMKIKLDKAKSDICNILKITDIANLSIQETLEDLTTENIVDNKQIDVSLPLSKAFKVGHWNTGYHGIAHTYNIEKIFYKYVKVDNENIVKKYLEYLKGYDSNSDDTYWGFYVDNLIDQMNIESNIPSDGWEELTSRDTNSQPTEEGLYFLWIKAPKTSENKELIGCVFSKRFSDISVLEKQLADIQSKNTELTATVSYNPNNTTTGNVVATIKTNKKVNKVEGWTLLEDGKTLTKTYSANATETVHLVDVDGMTKNVIVKVDNITSVTQKQDDTSNEKKDTTVASEILSEQDNKEDPTIANKILPQTGVNITITVASVVTTIVVALIFYKKYNDYKDIK